VSVFCFEVGLLCTEEVFFTAQGITISFHTFRTVVSERLFTRIMSSASTSYRLAIAERVSPFRIL